MTTLLLVASLAQPCDPEKMTFRVGCGATALFLLLQDAGTDVRLVDIEAMLPAPDGSAGIQEIAAAATRLGKPLIPRRMTSAGGRCDVPFIILLEPLGGDRHFVVVKPLSNTTSVQILDGQTYPRVVSWSELFASPVWKGVALVPLPYHPSWLRPLLIAVITAGAFCVTLPLAWRTRVKSLQKRNRAVLAQAGISTGNLVEPQSGT